MIATLVAVCTIPATSCSQPCVPNDRCLFDRCLFHDPLLVSNLCENFTPTKNAVLFDSGASVHCCPPCFGSNWPLLPLHGITPEHKFTSGEVINVHGKRLVGSRLEIHVAHIQFYVCDIHFPLISVSRLTAQGYATHLETNEMTWTAPSAEVVCVHCAGPMFYLEPTILQYVEENFDNVCASMKMQLAATTLDSTKQIFYPADR